MRTQRDRRRQLFLKVDRITSGDERTYTERVADALTALADEIECNSDPNERLTAWADAMGFVSHRVSRDWFKTTGKPLGEQ